MNAIHNALGTLSFIALLVVGYAFADNAGEYAAPTPSEIEADVQTQHANLCNVDGWPDSADSKIAFQRACGNYLR